MACPHPGRLLDGVDRVRSECGLPPAYPTLRVIDAACWMLGSRANNVSRFMDENRDQDPDFTRSRRAFWHAIGSPDPLAPR